MLCLKETSLPEYKDSLIVGTGFHLFSLNLGFFIAKKYPFKYLFNYALSKMQESGEFDRIKNTRMITDIHIHDSYSY